ncbi:MAG: DMT family transporter [Candidatus Micrarchaeota archaeon]
MQELLFAFLALFGFGSKDVLNKLILKKLDVYSTLIIEYFLALFLFAAAILLFSKPVFPQADTLLLIILSTVIGSASIVSYFKAVQSSKVSLIFAIAGSYPLFAILFSVFFLGEAFLSKYFIVLPALLVALFLLGYSKKQGKLFEPAVWLALLACVGWGANFTLAKVISSSINPFNTTLFMEGGLFIGISAYALLSRKKLSLPKSGQGLLFLSYVALFALAAVSMNISLLTNGVPLTTLITASAPGLTAIISRVFLKEKLSLRQYAGILLLVISLAVLSL